MHARTRILFNSGPTHAPAAPLDPGAEHLGVSWAQLHLPASSVQKIAVCCCYLPTTSSAAPQAYKDSLVRHIIADVKNLRSEGFAIIVALDANCTFKEPHVNPPSKNLPFFKQLQDGTSLISLN